MKKLRVGDKIYSKYFGTYIKIESIDSNTDWWFKLPDGRVLKANTPLSYFELREEQQP